MRNVMSIFRREIKSYFLSPIAYVVMTLFLLISGIVFYIIFNQLASESVGMSAGPFNAPQWIVRSYTGFISTVLLFLLPLITMGVYAEEKKKGTYELLFTSPLTNLQIIMGKLLANSCFCLVLFAGSVLLMMPLFWTEPPAIVPLLVSYLGLLLFSLSVLALGSFISTLTENQIVAAIMTFVLVLVLWFMNFFARTGSEGFQGVLAYLSPLQHLENFQKGVLDLTHTLYFLSVAVFGVFLTYRSLDSMRWRG